MWADPTDAAVAAATGLALRRDDPLRFRRLSSLGQRRLFQHVAAAVEVYAHAGNAAGKTEAACHLALTFCRGIRRVDGRLMVRPGEEADELSTEPCWIDMPAGATPGNPWHHWCLVTSYDQAKLSSVRAFRRLLGRWPHKIGWVDKSRGTVKTIRVKPDGWESDDPTTWSEITFISQENMTDDDVAYIRGARVNSVQSDESPLEFVWREIRARADANLELYLWIGYTPEKKPEWEWLLDDFRACYESPANGRVRIQWSVDENRALSEKDLAKRRARYAGDELFEARWNGEHVDVSGQSPFRRQRPQLVKLLDHCRSGRMEKITLRTAPPPGELDDREVLPEWCWIERWFPRDPYTSYLLTIDPSRGIDDDDHDPCELEVVSWPGAELVCRFGQRNDHGGYLDADSIGILADILGRQYNDAYVDIETNGGFADGALLTLRKRRYPNLAHDDVTDTPGQILKPYGWSTSASTLGEMISAIQEALKSGALAVWSRDVIQQLLDVVETPDGKPTTRRGARHHREAMICLGRALHLIATRRAPVRKERTTETTMAKTLEQSFGRPVVKPRKKRRGFTEAFS